MRTAILSLLLAASASAQSQRDLNTALRIAEITWGQPAHAAAITAAPLGPCGIGRVVGWTDFATRIISINSNCAWTKGWLQTIVTHEAGHLLTGQGHSQNRHSVMFSAPMRVQWWQFLDRPHVTADDKRLIAER